MSKSLAETVFGPGTSRIWKWIWTPQVNSTIEKMHSLEEKKKLMFTMSLNYFCFWKLKGFTGGHFIENSFQNRCFSASTNITPISSRFRLSLVSYFVRPHMSNFGRFSHSCWWSSWLSSTSFIRDCWIDTYEDESSSIGCVKFIFDEFENQLFEWW